MRAARLRAVGVEVERVLADRETALLRHFQLPLLDLGIVELLDATALHAHEVVVMLALVELEHRLARLEMVPHEKPGLLELRQHAIDGREADVETCGEQHLVCRLTLEKKKRKLNVMT